MIIYFIVFLDRPKLNIKQTPRGDLIQGVDVTLTCTVDSRPYPHYIGWYNVTGLARHHFPCSNSTKTECSLRLSNIDILHSGTYQCEAFNGVGGSPVKRNKTIRVFGECMLGNLYSKSSLFCQILIRVELYMNVLFTSTF